MSNALRKISPAAAPQTLEEALRELPEAYRQWHDKARHFARHAYVNEDLIRTFSHFALLKYEADRKPYYDFSRRVVDFLAATSILIVLSPLLAACALAIKISNPGPALFRQLRVGRMGELFWIYKFRTMVVDAERIHAIHVPLEKPSNDPRTTEVGRLLRQRKWDELPQLFNVILGNMSLIGPRPYVIEETATTPQDYLVRFAVRPGLAGLWQGKYPNTIPGELKMKLDCEYVINRAWGTDVKIWFQSLRMFLHGERK